MALTISRGLYTSYGKTVVVDCEDFSHIHDKIGSIMYAGVSLSSKQAFMLRQHASIPFANIRVALGAIGPHQWNVPVSALTPSYHRVRSSNLF